MENNFSSSNSEVKVTIKVPRKRGRPPGARNKPKSDQDVKSGSTQPKHGKPGPKSKGNRKRSICSPTRKLPTHSTPSTPATKAAAKLRARSRQVLNNSSASDKTKKPTQFTVPDYTTSSPPATTPYKSRFHRRPKSRSPTPESLQGSPDFAGNHSSIRQHQRSNSPAGSVVSEDRAEEGDLDILQAELEETEGIKPFTFTDAAVRLLIKTYAPRVQAYKTAKDAGCRKKVWSEVENVMTEQGYEADGRVLRKKYQSLLSTYKAVMDNNSKSGRARRTFKFEDDFTNIFADISNHEIDVPVADSCIPEDAPCAKRLRPKGKQSKSDYEEQRLELLRQDVENRKAHQEAMLENDRRKTSLLERLISRICE